MRRSLTDEFPRHYVFSERAGGTLSLRLDDPHPVQTDISLVLSLEGVPFAEIPLGSNIITNLGRSAMAHLLAGDSPSSLAVTLVTFGDGGHDPSAPTQALPPAPTDVALFGNTIISKATSFSFPDGSSGTKVQFTATVAEDEGNGTSGAQAYSEVGLKNVSGQLISHKTFGLITKSDAFALTINYTILF